VDPIDSPPPQGMAGDGDNQRGALADRPEGTPGPLRRVGSNDTLLNMMRNFGLLQSGEHPILAVRRHPAVLIWFLFITLVGLGAAGALSADVTEVGKNGTIFSLTLFHHVEKLTGHTDSAIAIIWLAWGLIFLYLVYKVIAWIISRFVITNSRMTLISGALVLRYASVRISTVTSWYWRDSLGGRMLGYRSLVFKVGDDGVLRTVGYVPFIAFESIEKALPSAAQMAGDEEAFNKWSVGGPRRRVRLIIAILLTCLLVALAVAAAINPRIRTELTNETEIIALLPVLIVLITPKN
jgi:hypothetical protein